MSCVNREQLRKDLLLYAVTDRSWLGNETLCKRKGCGWSSRWTK